MKTKLLLIILAVIAISCEPISEDNEHQKQKVYIWTNARPFPWNQGGNDFIYVKCAVDIYGQIQDTIYKTESPSCGEFSNDYIVFELDPGVYKGTIQHWCGFRGYNETRGEIQVKFTVTNQSECIVLDAGNFIEWE